jgi:mobilome CxxCx(11)CxxC protein
MRTAESDMICQESWDRAVHAYGIAAVFQKRAKSYGSLIRALTFMGIIVPLLIGGVVVGFGIHASHLEFLLGIAAFVGLIQLFCSAWSLVYKWDDKLAYSLESAAENLALSSEFEELGKLATHPPPDLEVRSAAAKAKDEARRASDAKQGLWEQQLRIAHRAGLRQFRRACVKCGQIPYSMEPTDCPVCGRFKVDLAP